MSIDGFFFSSYPNLASSDQFSATVFDNRERKHTRTHRHTFAHSHTHPITPNHIVPYRCARSRPRLLSLTRPETGFSRPIGRNFFLLRTSLNRVFSRIWLNSVQLPLFYSLQRSRATLLPPKYVRVRYVLAAAFNLAVMESNLISFESTFHRAHISSHKPFSSQPERNRKSTSNCE